jgi:hypothetical protein
MVKNWLKKLINTMPSHPKYKYFSQKTIVEESNFRVKFVNNVYSLFKITEREREWNDVFFNLSLRNWEDFCEIFINAPCP